MSRVAAFSKKNTRKRVVSAPAMRAAGRRARVGKPVAAQAAGTPLHQLNEAERQEMVATAAYYIAERRGFNSGDELADWLAAEEQIAEMLQESSEGMLH